MATESDGGFSCVDTPSGERCTVTGEGSTRDREYGYRGDFGNNASSREKNEVNRDINTSSTFSKTENSKKINSGKVLSSLVGIGISGLEVASLIAGGGVVETVTLGAGLSIIGSAFAIPALILSGVGFAYALSGEQNEDTYDGFDLATNPLMLIGYVSSDISGKDKKTSMQNAKYISTFSKLMDGKKSISGKELSEIYGIEKSVLKNIDALQSTLETKDDLDKIRMSKLP